MRWFKKKIKEDRMATALRKTAEVEDIDSLFRSCESCGAPWSQCIRSDACCDDCEHDIDDDEGYDEIDRELGLL